MKNYDAIVAGAGIWGCTVARRLAEAGKKVLVLEKRNVVGGNSRSEIDPQTGIEIHSYGAHIFHTHIPEVWEYVNRFVSFNGYQHKVLAKTKSLPWKKNADGDAERVYFLPLGLTLINKFFGVELSPGQVDDFLDGKYTPANYKHGPVLADGDSNAPVRHDRRQAIFDAFFRGYTSKQWGRPPEEIDSSIIKRVPVRKNYDINYYNDYWQGIPSTGYNSLFERLLDHANITVVCGRKFDLNSIGLEGYDVTGDKFGTCAGNHDVASLDGFGDLLDMTGAGTLDIYYSGPIDALFGNRFGALPWRTVRFEYERLETADYQGTSVMNYVESDVPYTRIHEFKHFHPEMKDVMGAPQTIIAREYPKPWEEGDEPYYPIDNAESREMLTKYQMELEEVNKKLQPMNVRLVVGGRLGEYKYYDMDQAMKRALDLAI